MARINITDVYQFGKRAVDKAYLDIGKYPFIVKRLPLDELTTRYSIYEDIVRKSQELFNVRIYRNKNSIWEGLYIVGRENFVDQCRKWISMIISRVEEDTWENGNPPRVRGRVHGNRAYSNYAHNKVKKIISTVIRLVEYKGIICIGEISQRCSYDELLNRTYCQQLSVLKNKTKYNGDIRHTN